MRTSLFPPLKGSRYRGLVPLLVPVPPDLAEVLGYQETGRYLALSFGASDNTLQISDGRLIFETSNWGGWLAFYKHPSVYPVLSPLRFGQSVVPPRRILLLDRERSKLYAASPEDAERFFAGLRDSGALPVYPLPEAPTEESLRQVDRFALTSSDINELDLEPLTERVATLFYEKRRLTDDMLAWLNNH